MFRMMILILLCQLSGIRLECYPSSLKKAQPITTIRGVKGIRIKIFLSDRFLQLESVIPSYLMISEVVRSIKKAQELYNIPIKSVCLFKRTTLY